MAKVTMPLLSGSASGKLGTEMVFAKNNVVRKYVVPGNPQTPDQMTLRNTLGDLQRALKKLGAVLRAELRSGFGARWNTVIIKELMANDKAALTTYTAEFTAFTSQEKTDWGTADTAVPVLLVDGVALYACASAAYDIAARLGVNLSLTLPAAGNSTTVGAEWIDDTP